jgi:hypothetical protein
MSTPSVAFSELSKHSKDVASKVERAGRILVTRRDGADLILTTELHDRQREEAVDIASRVLAVLLTSDEGGEVVIRTLPMVFPWIRHLNDEERLEFAHDLMEASRDMTELDVPANLHRILVGWKATARILADPEQLALAMRPLAGNDSGNDNGEVPTP